MAKPLPTDAMDNMPKELLAGIGEVVARWGYLQFQLGVVIREACRLEKETGQLLLSNTSIHSLCSSIKTLAKTDRWVKDAATRADMAALAKDVMNAKDVRNEYAHGVFSFSPTPGDYVRWDWADKSKRAPALIALTEAGVKADAKIPRDLWERAQALTKQLKSRNRAGP